MVPSTATSSHIHSHTRQPGRPVEFFLPLTQSIFEPSNTIGWCIGCPSPNPPHRWGDAAVTESKREDLRDLSRADCFAPQKPVRLIFGRSPPPETLAPYWRSLISWSRAVWCAPFWVPWVTLCHPGQVMVAFLASSWRCRRPACRDTQL